MIQFARCLLLGILALAIAAPVSAADDVSTFPGIDKLPEGYAKTDEFIAGAGIPYTIGDIYKLPTKPIYWVDKGKIIGFQVVMDEKQIAKAVDLLGIVPIPGLPPINHIDFAHYDWHGVWANPTWEIRVEFVSSDYLKQMTGL